MPYVFTGKSRQTTLKIFVQPKARRTLIMGLHDNMVKLAVAAPPVDDKANREVIAFLSGFFGVKKKAVKIIAGRQNRRKLCTVEHLSEEEIRQKVKSYLQG